MISDGRPLRVLFLDHTSLVSGAQRALIDLIAALPDGVHPTVMCPEGQLADMVRQLGVPVLPFRGTAGSLRLHPRHTPQAFREIGSSGRALARAAKATRADVIHANSIRAGLIAGTVRPWLAAPIVVHIHDALPQSASASLVRRLVCHTADALITISDYTTRAFVAGRGARRVRMLFNPLDVSQFDPASLSRADARNALGIETDAKVVGQIAQITPWKGQDVAIRALSLLAERHRDARLLIVGETKFIDKATRFDNTAFLAELKSLVASLGLDARVEFWGERSDVPAIVRSLDVLLAPSWEEPFGRSIIEAMALETPVIATAVGGPSEFIDDGVDGIVLPPRDPGPWAAALDALLDDEARRKAIGQRASGKVREKFDRDRYARAVVDVYDGLLGRTKRRRLLFVDHQDEIGGGQRSLLELLRTLGTRDDVHLACPPGALSDAARQLGVNVHSIRCSQPTFRVSLVQTPRELVRAFGARRDLRRHILAIRPEVVHANSLRAGLLVSTLHDGPPRVVHCRDLLPANPLAWLVRSFLSRRADAVIAVSKRAAEQFHGRTPLPRLVVIDNPVDTDRFDPSRVDGRLVREELGIDSSPVLGIVAQITPWKGQDRAIRILERIRGSHPDAQLVIAGSAKFIGAATTYDNRAYERRLHALVEELGLSDAVHFLGERNDVEQIVAALDVLLVPSTEEPFGRTIIEALAMDVPVVATDRGGPPEILRNGVDGRVLPPDAIALWASAVDELLRRHPSGESRSYALERFGRERHAACVEDVYDDVLRSRRQC